MYPYALGRLDRTICHVDLFGPWLDNAWQISLAGRRENGQTTAYSVASKLLGARLAVRIALRTLGW